MHAAPGTATGAIAAKTPCQATAWSALNLQSTIPSPTTSCQPSKLSAHRSGKAARASRPPAAHVTARRACCCCRCRPHAKAAAAAATAACAAAASHLPLLRDLTASIVPQSVRHGSRVTLYEKVNGDGRSYTFTGPGIYKTWGPKQSWFGSGRASVCDPGTSVKDGVACWPDDFPTDKISSLRVEVSR